MPSAALLQSARDGFPEAGAPPTEKAAIYSQLVRANVLVQNIQEKMLYDEDDVEYHDMRAIHSAIKLAQEYLR